MEGDDLLRRSDSRLLARLIEEAAAPNGPWRAGDLAGVLRHQLAAPPAADLAADDPALQAALEGLALAARPPIRSFADLFHHPQPPLELLQRCHRFAKRHLSDPAGPLPPEVASVLYYAAILAALRIGQSITRLGDHDLRTGAAWLASQPWLDEQTRSIMSAPLPPRRAAR